MTVVLQCDIDDFKVKLGLPEESNECRVIARLVVDDYFRNREDCNGYHNVQDRGLSKEVNVP